MFNSTLVHEWLTFSAQRFPDKPAIICAERTLSYRQLDSDSNRLADTLLEQGLSPQDRIVLFMDNSIETVVGIYGVLKAGGVFVVLNTSLKADKLAYILDNADAITLISHTSKARIVIDALNKVQSKPKTIWVHPGKTLPEPIVNATSGLHWDSIMQGPLSGKSRPSVTDCDMAALIYTSGSTGQPKGVIQPHVKMVSVAKSIIQYLENTSDEIILNVLSLSFGYGLYQILMSVMAGGTVVLERSFVYLHDVMRKVSQYKVTAFPMVPTITAMMLNMNEISSYDFSSLRYITSAGAALPSEHARRMRQLWPHVQIIPMHGLTECVRTCYLPPDQIDIHPDSVGIAIPGCRLSIVDENGNEVAADQVGEMVVSGVNVMPGYWKDPELTAQVFRPGRNPGQTDLYTGDLFKRDSQGYLYFVARKDDMIKTRGERVSPREIENTLLKMEGIAEAAVIGIPEPVLGQVPKAFLVKKTDSMLTENEVFLFASQNMENYMVPKAVQFLDDLPKTPNGKINKLILKKQENSI
jgi:amino acid adenylation domain-containing protein